MKERVLFKLAWERYKIFGQIFGDAQGRVFTQIFYFTIMVPFGIGVRVFMDPLHLKEAVHWVDREPLSSSLEDARRQG